MVDKGLLQADTAWAKRVAANRGAYFSGVSDMIVQVVDAGTEIESHDGSQTLTVDGATAVRRDNHIFVTQEHWDALIEKTEIRQFSMGFRG